MSSTTWTQEQDRIQLLRRPHQQQPENEPPPPATLSRGPSSGQHDLLSTGNPLSAGVADPSLWDWDPPLNDLDPLDFQHYEPQGELLQQDQQTKSKPEFHIPQPVGSPILSLWPGGAIVESLAVLKGPQPAGAKRKSTGDREVSFSDQQPRKRLSRTMSGGADDGISSFAESEGTGPGARPGAARTRSATDIGGVRDRPAAASTSGSRRPSAGVNSDTKRTMTDPVQQPMVLPMRKVFPIQIGDRLFRLSGASISSDAPSYFSQFFEEQLRQNEGADSVRTLYIDRDPATFEDISLHLQGYHIEPRDGPHFVKLFADAQFFSLPRLIARLNSTSIYVRVGDSEFQIPRDLFSNPGDSPNYFTLGFSSFFTTPEAAFPGTTQRTLLRPPSLLPPYVPSRSARTFADLLHILKGYPFQVRSEEHRAEMLRDARYFHLKGLEQRLMPHQISYNVARQKSEILVRLEDLRQSGISFVSDSSPAQSAASAAPSPGSSTSSAPPNTPGWIYYQRPYVDSEGYSLIVEINDECFVSLAPAPRESQARLGRATFFRQTLSRATSLFSVIANKMNLPVTQPLGLMMLDRGAGVQGLPVSPGNTGMSDDRVKVRLGADAAVTVDGNTWSVDAAEYDDEEDEDDDEAMETEGQAGSARERRKRQGRSGKASLEWVVRKAQWRLRVQPAQTGAAPSGRSSGMEVIMGAVKIEAYSSERARNSARGFLV